MIKSRKERKTAPLKVSRRSNIERRPHQDPKIRCTDMNQYSFENIFATPQMRAAHSSGLVKMSEWSLQSFSSLSQQCLASLPAYSPAILINSSLCFAALFPMAPFSLRFGNIGSQTKSVQIHNSLGAVISFVDYNFLDPFVFRKDRFHLLGCRDQSFDHGSRIAAISRLNRSLYNDSGFKIHTMFEFMRQMSPPVLHLRDSGVRIMRMSPIVVGPLFSSLSVNGAIICGRGGGKKKNPNRCFCCVYDDLTLPMTLPAATQLHPT